MSSHFSLVFLSSALCFLQLTAFSQENYKISMDGNGWMKISPKAATLITPVEAIAVFFDSSRFGFWTGTARGSITFAQSNYPSHPATVINMALLFPPWQEDRTYVIEVLFNGTLDRRYCQDGVRYIELQRFKLPAYETFYSSSFKRHDVSVIDENDTVIGRTIRVMCIDCHYGIHRMGGCTIIGRSDDEVYTEESNDRGGYTSGSMKLNDLVSSANALSNGIPPGVMLVLKNPLPERLSTPWTNRRRN